MPDRLAALSSEVDMSNSADGFPVENDYDKLLSHFKQQLDAGGEPYIDEYLAKCRRDDQLSCLFVALLTLELERDRAKGKHLSEEVKRIWKQRFPRYESEIEQVWLELDIAKSGAARDVSITATESSAAPSIEGDTYKFDRVIGKGAFGEVWHATHNHLGCSRAIKILNREFHGKQSFLLDEARRWVNLRNSGIVAVYHVGLTLDKRVFIDMEYMSHGTLRDLMQKPGFDGVRDGAPLVKKIANAVQYLHENHLNHFDLKPENILLDEHNNPKLGDFGLAVHHSERRAGSNRQVGTPGYAAPEMY
jgi:hypothetical protein